MLDCREPLLLVRPRIVLLDATGKVTRANIKRGERHSLVKTQQLPQHGHQLCPQFVVLLLQELQQDRLEVHGIGTGRGGCAIGRPHRFHRVPRAVRTGRHTRAARAARARRRRRRRRARVQAALLALGVAQEFLVALALLVEDAALVAVFSFDVAHLLLRGIQGGAEARDGGAHLLDLGRGLGLHLLELLAPPPPVLFALLGVVALVGEGLDLPLQIAHRAAQVLGLARAAPRQRVGLVLDAVALLQRGVHARAHVAHLAVGLLVHAGQQLPHALGRARALRQQRLALGQLLVARLRLRLRLAQLHRQLRRLVAHAAQQVLRVGVLRRLERRFLAQRLLLAPQLAHLVVQRPQPRLHRRQLLLQPLQRARRLLLLGAELDLVRLGPPQVPPGHALLVLEAQLRVRLGRQLVAQRLELGVAVRRQPLRPRRVELGLPLPLFQGTQLRRLGRQLLLGRLQRRGVGAQALQLGLRLLQDLAQTRKLLVPRLRQLLRGAQVGLQRRRLGFGVVLSNLLHQRGLFALEALDRFLVLDVVLANGHQVLPQGFNLLAQVLLRLPLFRQPLNLFVLGLDILAQPRHLRLQLGSVRAVAGATHERSSAAANDAAAVVAVVAAVAPPAAPPAFFFFLFFFLFLPEPPPVCCSVLGSGAAAAAAAAGVALALAGEGVAALLLLSSATLAACSAFSFVRDAISAVLSAIVLSSDATWRASSLLRVSEASRFSFSARSSFSDVDWASVDWSSRALSLDSVSWRRSVKAAFDVLPALDASSSFVVLCTRSASSALASLAADRSSFSCWTLSCSFSISAVFSAVSACSRGSSLSMEKNSSPLVASDPFAASLASAWDAFTASSSSFVKLSCFFKSSRSDVTRFSSSRIISLFKFSWLRYSMRAVGSRMDVRGVFSRSARSKGSIADTRPCAIRYDRRSSGYVFSSLSSFRSRAWTSGASSAFGSFGLDATVAGAPFGVSVAEGGDVSPGKPAVAALAVWSSSSLRLSTDFPLSLPPALPSASPPSLASSSSSAPSAAGVPGVAERAGSSLSSRAKASSKTLGSTLGTPSFVVVSWLGFFGRVRRAAWPSPRAPPVRETDVDRRLGDAEPGDATPSEALCWRACSSAMVRSMAPRILYPRVEGTQSAKQNKNTSNRRSPPGSGHRQGPT
ncbi:uncharacterized protein SPSK_03907 [Sporothrix schenckii 1099-18]|uniref:Uncharacterized protein n=1 Tax=Sporothrix schenckii 1099-18 TaxID=1397361 RepID=A0A0F2M559_SPOSC|nr:uncharacterized protein SPSK_03907 [Sporothrix schenckii 1099-18]KJR83321.1 hypothetical protein SPSK_03907 [Sporothrix schenckii 1099-18]